MSSLIHQSWKNARQNDVSAEQYGCPEIASALQPTDSRSRAISFMSIPGDSSKCRGLFCAGEHGFR